MRWKNIEFFRIFKKKENLIKLIISLIILFVAFQLFNITGKYAESQNAPALGDWIHDHLHVIDLNWLVSWGYPVIITLLSLFFIIKEPKNINKFVIMVSAMMIIRGLFYSMTHLGAPLIRIDDVTDIAGIKTLDYTKDLFFSGHISVPFLGFLIAKNKKVKALSLLASIIMGFGVLAMHVHYSIDVFGGYFIVFGMFYIINKYLGKYIETK